MHSWRWLWLPPRDATQLSDRGLFLVIDPVNFLDHDARSYELIARVFAGESEGLTRDDVLDNITHTWLTNTGVSGAVSTGSTGARGTSTSRACPSRPS